jgi:hypothetical protein
MLEFAGKRRTGRAYHLFVADGIEALERKIDQLRVSVREAVLTGDRPRASARRAELRQAEQAWEEALAAASPEAAAPGAPAAPRPSGSLLPLREQVYEALALLQVPAAPKLIATVHEAFFGAGFPPARVTSLKRDEERSFRSGPFARPYYICAGLSAASLAPSRGLLAVSTWPAGRRTVGPLSPRADFLTAALRIAEAVERIPDPPPAARRLLHRFAASIPGAVQPSAEVTPAAVRRAAGAELAVHAGPDGEVRREAAGRLGRLAPAEQLFGIRAAASGSPASGAAGPGSSGAGPAA